MDEPDDGAERFPVPASSSKGSVYEIVRVADSRRLSAEIATERKPPLPGGDLHFIEVSDWNS